MGTTQVGNTLLILPFVEPLTPIISGSAEEGGGGEPPILYATDLGRASPVECSAESDQTLRYFE